MSISGHLHTAMALGLTSDPETRSRWRDLLWKMSSHYGVHFLRRHALSNLDMMLRGLEKEMVGLVQNEARPELIDDIHNALSEQWLIGTYELIRTRAEIARKKNQSPERVTHLRDRFELVRIPLAKGQIADRRLSKTEKAALKSATESQFESCGYMMNAGICLNSGSIIWFPYDPVAGQEVGISRRSLSDELLSVFD